MTIRFSCLANNFSLSFAWCVRAQVSELCQLNQIKSNLILAQGKQTWELLFWRTSGNPRFFQILNNPSLSHAGQNYWMLIGCDRGHFSLIKRALLVVKRAWLLDADWLSMPALNWFPTSNGVWKGISETLRFWVWSQHGHFILTWKKINTQQSAVFWWKSKFSDQKCIDSQPENSLSGNGCCWTKH